MISFDCVYTLVLTSLRIMTAFAWETCAPEFLDGATVPLTIEKCTLVF